MPEPNPLPPSLKEHFGDYAAWVVDGWCGETIGWGYKPLHYMGESLWDEAKKHGDWHCFKQGDWVLIIRWLTPEEAEKQYGKISHIETGPQGGFKSVAYGEKTFVSSHLVPRSSMETEFWANTKIIWEVTVWVNRYEDKEPSTGFLYRETVDELRAMSEWYRNQANLYERMFEDGWTKGWHGRGLFTRNEIQYGVYKRKRLVAVLEGLDVKIGPIRQTRRVKE